MFRRTCFGDHIYTHSLCSVRRNAAFLRLFRSRSDVTGERLLAFAVCKLGKVAPIDSIFQCS
jgi:hypothetical protein